MTQYLNQYAIYEQHIPGTVDMYGKAAYRPSKTIKCRRELADKEITDRTGKTALSTVTYYLDTSIGPAIGDKLDGRLVLAVEEYVIGVGVLIGWECHA
jgi:hypothetical protein